MNIIAEQNNFTQNGCPDGTDTENRYQNGPNDVRCTIIRLTKYPNKRSVAIAQRDEIVLKLKSLVWKIILLAALHGYESVTDDISGKTHFRWFSTATFQIVIKIWTWSGT